MKNSFFSLFLFLIFTSCVGESWTHENNTTENNAIENKTTNEEILVASLPQKPETVSVKIVPTSEITFTAYFSDGATTYSKEDYEKYVRYIQKQNIFIESVLLTDDEPIARTTPGERHAPLAIKIFGTDFTIVVTAHKHPLGGCINKNVWHTGFLISKKGQKIPIVDLHIAGWTENGKPCVGIYVSPQGWCWKSCGPSYTDIQSAITAALAGYLGYQIAAYMATVLTPIAVGALAVAL